MIEGSSVKDLEMTIEEVKDSLEVTTESASVSEKLKKNFSEEFEDYRVRAVNNSDVNLSEFFAISDPAGIAKSPRKLDKNFSYEGACGHFQDELEPIFEQFEELEFSDDPSEFSEVAEVYESENSKKQESYLEMTKTQLENFKLPIDHVEAAQNYQGNYQNYVSRVLKSLLPLRCVNFSSILAENKINLKEIELNKKTLILDLDETLIHADFDNHFKGGDHLISFFYEGQEVQVPIIIRPGLFEFLQNISELFEIFIFTASRKEYADAVLNYLDPENKIFKKRFYREHCINIQNRIYIKDLRIFANRKLENLVIVDNSLYSFANQLSNGILINSFYHDKEDKELYNLFNYLQHFILNAPDLRVVNDKIFSFNSILEEFSNYYSTPGLR